MALTAELLRPEGEQSGVPILQRAGRLFFSLLKVIAFAGGALVFLMGLSLISINPNNASGWFLSLLPLIVWKILWIWGRISWLIQKFWTFCVTIFRYIHLRNWTAIAFWLAIIWYDKPWGSLAFIISTFVVGNAPSELIDRILAIFGLKLGPGCCCHHHSCHK